MAWVYIIQNDKERKYVGITNQSIEDRIADHKSGKVISTRYSRVWRLAYQEYFPNMKLARAREKQIKSWKGGNALKRLLSNPPRSSNGRTPGSGPGNHGSSPCLGGLERN